MKINERDIRAQALQLALCFQWYYGLTNRETARALGVEASTYSNWARGAYGMSRRNAIHVLEAIPQYVQQSFDVSLDFIWNAQERRQICVMIAHALKKQRQLVRNEDMRGLLSAEEKRFLFVIDNSKGGEMKA